MVQSKKLSDRILDGFIILLMVVISLTCILPVINTLAMSLSSNAAASAGKVLFWPVDFTLSSYKRLMGDVLFLNSFWISIKRVLIGGGLSMVLTITIAYPLSKSKKQFGGRDYYMWIVVFTMLFSGGVVPWFMVIKSMGLVDTFWALILPSAVNSYNTILMMNFFRNVPVEMEESAIIDGAGPIRTLVSIYLPVSLPALATIGLLTIVRHWNAFFDGLVLINKPDKLPLQTYIQQLVVAIDVTRATNPDELKLLLEISNRTFNSAKIFVSMIPILLVYPLLQRYFITGLTIGSVKE